MEKLNSLVWTRPWSLRTLRVIWHISTVIVAGLVFATVAEAGAHHARLSSDLSAHLVSASNAPVEIIINGSQEKIARIAQRHGLQIKRAMVSGATFVVSKQELTRLADDVEVDSLSANAAVHAHGVLTTDVTGADAAWAGEIAALGKVNGSGIGVAVIDSGIANHPALDKRVIASFDFTDPLGTGYDYYGHGTHVAGIIAARGYNNTKIDGTDSGMAPAAHLINMKVLDQNGNGVVADVVEAIDFAIAYRQGLGIRIINLSLGTAATQSYKDDPICQAVERAVKAGIVVVASAGNNGSTLDGKRIYGSITSPGISPYAITVGALRTQGTADPSDDEVAPWSSKGPTAIDRIIKPDLVAPGSKIVSTITEDSTLARTHRDLFLDGPGNRDYLSLSGTSMAAAVVSGAAALLLDSKPDLTALQVKVALQVSADFRPTDGVFTAGAGSLDLRDLDGIDDLYVSNANSSNAFAMSVPNTLGVECEVIIWSNGDAGITLGEDVIIWSNDVIIWSNDVIIWSNDVIIWSNDVIIWSNSTDDVIIWSNSADVIIWSNSADVIIWSNANVNGSGKTAQQDGVTTEDVIIWG